MSKLEMLKQLEYLVAFQTNCLQTGDWNNFDLLQNSICRLEENILRRMQEECAS